MLIDLLQTHRDSSSTFSQLADHLSIIANVPVRNVSVTLCVTGLVAYSNCTVHVCVQVGTWAGNLMLTHDHDDFPSDVFVIMAAVGAMLSVGQWGNMPHWHHSLVQILLSIFQLLLHLLPRLCLSGISSNLT